MFGLIKPSVVLTDGAIPNPGTPNCAGLNVNGAGPGPATIATDPGHRRDADALAYVMFTSVTSGTPKGVTVPRSGVVRLVCDADFAEFRGGARWVSCHRPLSMHRRLRCGHHSSMVVAAWCGRRRYHRSTVSPRCSSQAG